ncbi:MAG: DUF11 domain-containing protein, partial [Chloroflexi bacterium]|nr:DUF11 domain-containing protein [Chloroflexota bacterium]
SLIVDANDNGSFDDAADRLLRGVFDSAGNSVDFDGRDGSGVPLTGDRTYAVKLFALAGEIHYPMFDIESLGGLHIERLTTLGAGNIHQAHYDDLNGIALTNASPTSLAGGSDSSPHGSGFRGFTGTSGDEDVADSWTFTDAGTFATTSINFSIGTAANLAIDKSANPTNPSPGGTIEYVLTFSNAGTATATGIVVSDVVPISVTVTGTNCSADSSCVETTVTPPTYTWSVGDLAPGEGGVITITGQVLGSLGDKDGFFNTATIHGDSNDDSAWVEVEVFDPTAVTLASFEATQGDSAVAAANGLQAVAWGAVALLGLLAGAIFRRRR